MAGYNIVMLLLLLWKKWKKNTENHLMIEIPLSLWNKVDGISEVLTYFKLQLQDMNSHCKSSQECFIDDWLIDLSELVIE